MSKRMLSVSLFLLLGGCFGTLSPTVVRPPAPPEWVMKPCEPWPQIPGEGRVPPEVAAEAVAKAKHVLSMCAARHDGARHYIEHVVNPEGL